jgi:hypothetical protein
MKIAETKMKSGLTFQQVILLNALRRQATTGMLMTNPHYTGFTSFAMGVLYIHNGKDTDEKLVRAEHVANKVGDKNATYVMALLTLPQLMAEVMDTNKYKDFVTERRQRTIN